MALIVTQQNRKQTNLTQISPDSTTWGSLVYGCNLESEALLQKTEKKKSVTNPQLDHVFVSCRR